MGVVKTASGFGIRGWSEQLPDRRTVQTGERLVEEFKLVRIGLRERPGEWAIVADYSADQKRKSLAATRAKALTRAHAVLFEGLYEFASRNRCVYARYVGHGDTVS